MLNISKNPIHNKLPLSNFNAGKYIVNKNYYKQFNRLSMIFLSMVFIILLLPWTQNISGIGYVTTLNPSERPQTIQSAIPGRIEKWFVQEGTYVKKGDTILQISEVKSDYFDNKLLERTESQIKAKFSSAVAYQKKVNALQRQLKATRNEQKLKLEQAKNKLLQAKLKVKSDSIELTAAATNKVIAQTQYNRIVSLKEDGLKATKDVEEKRLKLQATQAKLISQENKLLASINNVINAKIELSSIDASYTNKISKIESEIHTAQSSKYNTQAQVSKLENSYSNYAKRTSLQFITSPQDGYINKALKGAIGETFKAGESIVNIMATNYSLAVETYVRPIDLPLIHINERVRIQFDGWPAIIFSGWEGISYGTYGSRVVAIENAISDNGMYRILLAPDEEEYKWPNGIRVGSGAKTIALLNDVPIWYELWRQLNGFPPNFYTPKKNLSKK